VSDGFRRRVLLTGFGPFPGVAENATGVLVPRLAEAARERLPGASVLSEILATEWDGGPARLAAVMEDFDPTHVLHLGVSERARGFVVERTARNSRNVTPDACGAIANSGCVLDDGPDTVMSTFPAEAIVARLAALGLPAVLSDDAGSYLCNAVLYHSLCRAAAGGHMRTIGFVHVPADLGRPGSALNWDNAFCGGLQIVLACLEASAPTA